MSTCAAHTEYADVSASTPAVVPEHYTSKSMSTSVLHYGHAEYADVSASTPAVVPKSMGPPVLHYGHAEYAGQPPAVVPEHYGHEEHVYPVLHYGHRAC
jgi:hypothetical protein